MMRYILIFFALLGIGYAQQADLPAGAKPYSGNLFRAVDGTIWTGKPGHYTNIGSKRYVDSLVNLGYKKHQVDSIALDTYNRARNRAYHIGTQAITTIDDLQAALDSKVDKSTTISGSGGISVGGSLATGAVSVGVNDTYFNNKYLRKDVDDNNGNKVLTVGKLVSQSVEADALNLSSLGTGTNTDQLLVVDGTGVVKKKSPVSDVNIGVANSAGTNQFSLGATDAIRFAGSGDASVSFNPATKTVTVTSVPGSGTGGAVSSFNGRTGAVVSASGDYSTDQVTEGSNQYFTDARTRAAVLTGFNPASTSPVSATDNVIQALGKLQGQMNTKAPSGRNLTVSGAAGRTIASGGTQNLTADREWTVDLAPSGVSAGTYTKVGVDNYGRVTSGAMATIADIPTLQGALAAKADVGGGNATGTWPISITGNAQTLGGASADVSYGPNSIVKRSAEGDISARYLRTQSVTGVSNTTPVTIFGASNGSTYIDAFSVSAVRQFLGSPIYGEDLQSILNRGREAAFAENNYGLSLFNTAGPGSTTLRLATNHGPNPDRWFINSYTNGTLESGFKVSHGGTVYATGGNSTQWNQVYNTAARWGAYSGVDASNIQTNWMGMSDGANTNFPISSPNWQILKFGSDTRATILARDWASDNFYFKGISDSWAVSRPWRRFWHDGDFTGTDVSNWKQTYLDRVTTNTPQHIGAKKVFQGGTGSGWEEGPMEIRGNGSNIYPNIAFHQPGVYARTLAMKNDGKFYIDNDRIWTTGDFNLDVQAANNTVPIRSSTGQIKAADALADEDLVTKRQVPALAAQGSGLVRTVYNNNDQFDFSASHSDNVFRSSVTGSTIQYTVPAGTFTINGSGSIRVKLLGGGGTSSGTNAPRRIIMRFSQSGRVWNVPVVLTNSASSITDFLFSADVNVLVTNPYTNGGARPYYAGMKVKSNVMGSGTGINGTQINSGYVHRNSSLSSNYIDYTQSFSIEFVSDNTGSGSQWTFILETVTIDISSNN